MNKRDSRNARVYYTGNKITVITWPKGSLRWFLCNISQTSLARRTEGLGSENNPSRFSTTPTCLLLMRSHVVSFKTSNHQPQPMTWFHSQFNTTTLLLLPLPFWIWSSLFNRIWHLCSMDNNTLLSLFLLLLFHYSLFATGSSSSILNFHQP